MGAQAMAYDHCLDVLTVEAMACRDGLILAERLGATRLCLETDCQELVNLWKNREGNRSVIAPILLEIHEKSVDFQDLSFLHASRLCNRVAHELAKQSSGELQTVVWHETPSCIHSLSEADCNQVH